MSDEPPHVTLVLGAGGPVGKAFHAGVLRALAERCGWEARTADVIVGTSAGSHIGALLRAGWEAHRLEQATTMSHHGDQFHELFSGRWSHRPLWIPAMHVGSGARVVFGRGTAPAIDLATAVRCSSAVPLIRQPVTVGRDRYIDGGVGSPTHADLALHAAPFAERRTVVVVSPLSRFKPLRWLLRWELRPLVKQGINIVLFEPNREVAAAMGWNPMNGRRAAGVAAATYRVTCERLQRAAVADAVRGALVGT
jgi:predicted acylesterase/phospholipase RssA